MALQQIFTSGYILKPRKNYLDAVNVLLFVLFLKTKTIDNQSGCMHGNRAWNLKNLNARQLSFTSVHSNNENLNTQ